MANMSKRSVRFVSVASVALIAVYFLVGYLDNADSASGQQNLWKRSEQDILRRQDDEAADADDGFVPFPESDCPRFTDYANTTHPPFSDGPLKLPYQRPDDRCRTFYSPIVEKVIEEFKKKIEDPDLARLFENTFPNTLDTTIRWHVNNTDDNKGPRSFIITGDINAEWIRDSRAQLYNYQELAPYDKKLQNLILGAINQQVEFVTKYPYCNAFQPPASANLKPGSNGQEVQVKPEINHDEIWECKYEIDSISSFFGLSTDYYEATGDGSFINDAWIKAAETEIKTIREQQTPTFAPNGTLNPVYYSFESKTWVSTGTLSLEGAGNPVNNNTNLIKSQFRPSDDSSIYPFFIPGNAQAVAELKRAAAMLKKEGHKSLANEMNDIAKKVEKDIWEYGTYDHPVFGEVFAFEVDGYEGRLFMDDANIPSLLTLPDVGFLNMDDETYQNTRKMIFSAKGNPYYVEGEHFKGIGGPHAGIAYAWPMSQIGRIRTTDDDDEIKEALKLLKNSTSGLGLMHESINVFEPPGPNSFTRPWFAWVNTEFARSIIDVAQRKPHLIFKNDEKLTLDDIGKKYGGNTEDSDD
ncbi:hypothetical protein TRICI_002633 [Trichomonascus ciferrii]|uniref:Glycoside hydrolase family 125 protein n=1 Tax=Trichomonascus ciferrii TaxID=44093 RepID=A0A642V683_9ASCO|nr:hypothetical protein TRICI_002633 [Trichomonascus ciferrii]